MKAIRYWSLYHVQEQGFDFLVERGERIQFLTGPGVLRFRQDVIDGKIIQCDMTLREIAFMKSRRWPVLEQLKSRVSNRKSARDLKKKWANIQETLL